MRAADLDPENPTVRAAVFGVQVQEFLQGSIGSFLISKAELRLQALVVKLKRHPAHDSMAIAILQAEIKHLELFESWLGDAVQSGLMAQAELEADQDAK